MSDVNYSDDPSALTPASLAAIRNRLQPQVMLQPVDHDPFAEVPGVGVVPTAVPAAARAVGEGMASWAAAPGNVYRGQQPQVPGQWSDVDEARAQLNAGGQYQWGPQTATMMVGGGSPFAEAGTAGIFGGKLAKTADVQALGRAQQMAAGGAARDEIWNQTGWFQGADQKWRFEIPDQSASLNPEVAGRYAERSVDSPIYSHDASEVMRHRELWNAYPDLAQIDTGLRKGGGYPYTPQGSMTVYESGKRQIDVNAPDAATARSINLNELQHGVQQNEGFAAGASPSDYKQGAVFAQQARDALSFRREMDALNMPDSGPAARENAVVEKYRNLGALDWLPSQEARDIAHDRVGFPDHQLSRTVAQYGLDQRATPLPPMDLYRRTAGEVEARNVQTRADMTPEQRAASPPWMTEDIPPEQQIVRGADEARGPQMSSAPIRAFHGSPYDFERFDLSKIGTGEGAQ